MEIQAFQETLLQSLGLQEPESFLPEFSNVREEFWLKLSLFLKEEEEKLKKTQAAQVAQEKSLVKVEEHVHGLEQTYLATKKEHSALKKVHEELHAKYLALGNCIIV